MFEYHTLNDLIKLSADNNLEIWEIIQQADMYENDRSESDSFNMMKEMYVAMKNADSMYDGTLRSASNKAGGDGGLLHSYNESGKNICGSFMGKVMEKAIKMGESNACMRRIVAAPTAGSCGVLPAVLLSYEEDFDVAENDMVKAMYVAAGIGKVIAENAFIAGAAGGCQAEIGSASAMAAGALAFLQGGDSPAQQGLRLHQPRRDGRSTSQRNGCRDRPSDDGWRHSMDSLLCGCGVRLFAQLARSACFGILFGYVHSIPPQRSIARGWRYQLVCRLSQQRRKTQQGSSRKRHLACHLR